MKEPKIPTYNILNYISENFTYDPENGEIKYRGNVLKFATYIFVDGVRFFVRNYRVAWYLANGVWADSEIDHKNGDRLDNRLSNLRSATRGQNAKNTKIPKTNTSGYKGVNFDKESGKWRAQITVDYKRITLGRFKTKEEAAIAYNEAAIKYYGEWKR